MILLDNKYFNSTTDITIQALVSSLSTHFPSVMKPVWNQKKNGLFSYPRGIFLWNQNLNEINYSTGLILITVNKTHSYVMSFCSFSLNPHSAKIPFLGAKYLQYENTISFELTLSVKNMMRVSPRMTGEFSSWMCTSPCIFSTVTWWKKYQYKKQVYYSNTNT